MLAMTNKDVAILILAAGKGTRLKSSLAKVLHAAGGRSLVEHVVRACEPLRAKKIIAVVGHQAEKVAAVLEPFEVHDGAAAAAEWHRPRIAGGQASHRKREICGGVARRRAAGSNRDVASADQQAQKRKCGGLDFNGGAGRPSGYGRILRKSGDTVAAIIEESQLTPEQRELNEINSSMYSFTMAKLWPALAQVKPNNKHREIYLTDAISVLNAKGETVLAEIAENAQETLGCNTRADLAGVDRAFREWKRDELMNSGVTIQLPETVLIDPEVTAGEDTVIEPCVQLLGKTKIGARCVIKTGSVIHDSVLGDNVTIEPHCVITEEPRGFRRCGRAVRAHAAGVAREGWRAHRQFRGIEEERGGRRVESAAPFLYRRHADRSKIEYWRGDDHLQLRRLREAPDGDREQSVYRERLGAGGSGANWKWGVRCRGIGDYRQCAARCAGNRARPPGE